MADDISSVWTTRVLHLHGTGLELSFYLRERLINEAYILGKLFMYALVFIQMTCKCGCTVSSYISFIFITSLQLYQSLQTAWCARTLFLELHVCLLSVSSCVVPLSISSSSLSSLSAHCY